MDTKWTVAGVAGGVFCAAFVGIGVARVPERALAQKGVTSDERLRPICAGGPSSDLELSVTPKLVTLSRGGEALTLSVRALSRLRKAARAQVAFQLSDDLGHEVRPSTISAVSRPLRRGDSEDFTYEVPAGLPDGYYGLHLTAVATDDESDASESASYYFEIAGTLTKELSSDEYYWASRANTGFQSVPPAVKAQTVKAASTNGPQVIAVPNLQCGDNCPPPPPPPTYSRGVVSGKLTFYNNQGNFCPTTGANARDCTGTRYPATEFATAIPVRDVPVEIWRQPGDVLVGAGVADSQGNFTVSWSVGGTVASIQAKVIWKSIQKDGRFHVTDSNGAQWYFPTATTLTLVAGTSASTPQPLGTFQWGTAIAPNQMANVYDGAWREWEVLKTSNRMLAFFTGLEIRAFVDDPVHCNTSCAFGDLNQIRLDPRSAYQPQARVMHEMGHIASYKANRDQARNVANSYCFPDSDCTDLNTALSGWSFNTAEWACSGFEEGLATFYGDAAINGPNMTHPHTCIATATECPTNLFDTEASTVVCAANEARWPITTVRYLWDAYDGNADRATETLQKPLYEFFDTINAFDNGTGNHQKDEPWSCFLGCTLSDRDGRSANDFRFNWSNWGTNSDEAYTNNCSPAGD